MLIIMATYGVNALRARDKPEYIIARPPCNTTNKIKIITLHTTRNLI